MKDKEVRYKTINSPYKLSKHKKTDQKTELLNLFATYIYMTNPDYKYNETYLKDKISVFWEQIEIYKYKVEFRDEILKKIKNIAILDSIKCKLSIQIDEVWELQYDSVSKDNNTGWIESICENPNLKSVDRKKWYIKCHFVDNHGIIFSDYLVSNDKNELLNFTSESVSAFVSRMEEE